MQQSARERHQALLKGKETLTENLAGLRSEQSAALINGTEFTHGADIRALTDDIEALDAAIKVVSVAAEAEEAKSNALARADQTAQQVETYEVLRGQYLDAWENMERLTGELHVTLSIIHSTIPQLATVLSQLSGQFDESLLKRDNIDTRLLSRMVEVLGDDMPALRAFKVARMESETWLSSWVGEEGSKIKNAFDKSVAKAKQLAEQLRRDAEGE
ncbi:hypothetical protein [Rhizobium ruizarguesonis]|uniref:hypothetical protein n=1 Tax=Rhizobium ruizarguesonis TaxID=2081791 RepID=UPI0013D4530E|nr:hypothetical protein [Rhizobium ruizarguesonis]NEH80571.1 hypothetical protein [Rhizobium ruizarguesonis]NEI75494.1 hypothetical protein [Rhizobium ruizarguesonis]